MIPQRTGRLTPAQFYQKNNNAPLLVVNCSFFSFATNQNLNVVIKDGKLIGYNEQTISGHGKDTLTYFHSFFGALGISKKRNADVAWVYTDSAKKYPYASQEPVHFIQDSIANPSWNYINKKTSIIIGYHSGNNVILLLLKNGKCRPPSVGDRFYYRTAR